MTKPELNELKIKWKSQIPVKGNLFVIEEIQKKLPEQNKRKSNELTLLKKRQKEVESKKRKRIQEDRLIQIDENKISNDLLEFIDNLSEEDFNIPSITPEKTDSDVLEKFKGTFKKYKLYLLMTGVILILTLGYQFITFRNEPVFYSGLRFGCKNKIKIWTKINNSYNFIGNTDSTSLFKVYIPRKHINNPAIKIYYGKQIEECSIKLKVDNNKSVPKVKMEKCNCN